MEILTIYVEEDKDEKNSTNMESEIESKVSTEDAAIGLCGLCLEVSDLQPLSNCQFAKEFNNFNFIEVEIGCKFPEAICIKCIQTFDEIGSFLIRCRNSYHTYSTMEKISFQIKTNNNENHVLSKLEVKQEEIDSNFELVTISEESAVESETLSTKFRDGIVDNSPVVNIMKEEEIISECQEKTDLKEHKKQNSSNQIKMCHACGACVPKLETHYKMSKSCRPRNFPCSNCNLHFSTNCSLLDHQRINHSDGTSVTLLKCDECSKTFKYDKNYKRHMLVHKNGKRFICEVCGKSFIRRANFNDHKNVHTQTKPYCCKFCGKCFRSKSIHTTHQRRHLTERISNLIKPEKGKFNENEELRCHICDRKFSRTASLKLHIKSHEEKREYECKKCRIQFETFQLYKEHHKIHQPDKCYKCIYCHKNFISEYHLENHVRVHTGERPFMCSQCGNRFRIHAHLQRHLMLIHSVNRGKPFECKFCEKTFLMKERLVCHLRIHTGERPYNCHVCGKDFIDVSSRKKHIRKIHGEDEVQNIYL